MSMPSAASVGELPKDVLWYKKDLPEGIETTKDLLRDYSGIPADKVEAHIKDVVSKIASFSHKLYKK